MVNKMIFKWSAVMVNERNTINDYKYNTSKHSNNNHVIKKIQCLRTNNIDVKARLRRIIIGNVFVVIYSYVFKVLLSRGKLMLIV